MTSPNDQTPPPPKRVLPYASPMRTKVSPRLGSFWGNMAVGLVVFVASWFVWPALSRATGMHSPDAATFLILPGMTLLLGVAAAFFPRYRGVLTGMLLVVAICVGLMLLIIGICSGMKF